MDGFPSPTSPEFILQGKGTLAVDEASLWPNGQFPTTVLVVTQNLLQNHPDVVRDLLKGLVQSVNWINANESTAPAAVNAALARPPAASCSRARSWRWRGLTSASRFDPFAADVQTDANNAEKLGFNKTSDIKGILDLGPLNASPHRGWRSDGQRGIARLMNVALASTPRGFD